MFEKREEMAEIMKERRTKAEEWMVSDAAGGAVTWKAASGAQSSQADVARNDESRGASTGSCSLGDRSLREQYWRFAEEEERSGMSRICRNTGLRILPTE